MFSEKIQQAEMREKELVRQYFQHAENGFFVEVGANEPTSIASQTWHLERIGWTGILIEPIKELFQEIARKRPRSLAFNVACSSLDKVGHKVLKVPYVGDTTDTGKASLEVSIDHAEFARYRLEHVDVVTLDSILERADVKKIDLLSIDVEGTELDVLNGFSIEKYKPRLILVEDKLVYLNKHRWLKKKGYRLIKRTGLNNWYVPRDAAPGLPRAKERAILFKKLYLSLLPRKIKVTLKMKSLKPLTSL